MKRGKEKIQTPPLTQSEAQLLGVLDGWVSCSRMEASAKKSHSERIKVDS